MVRPVLASSPRKPAPLPFDPAFVSDDIVLAQAQIALRGGLFDQALTCATIVVNRATDVRLRCEALRYQSNAFRLLCLWDEAIAAARSEAKVAEQAGLTERMAEALNGEAAVYLARGELEAAYPLLKHALDAANTPRLRGVLWQNLGMLEASRGRFAAADEALERSRHFFDEAGDLWGSACTLINQGCVRLDQRDFEGATRLLETAIAAGRAANDLDLVAGAMMNQARAYFSLGRLDDAEFQASSAAGFYVSSQMSLRYAECLMVLGDIEKARGEMDIARRCWTRGFETAEKIGAFGIRDEIRKRLQPDLDHSR
jgi:tetratricopeptide (TPR) repeat protein